MTMNRSFMAISASDRVLAASSLASFIGVPVVAGLGVVGRVLDEAAKAEAEMLRLINVLAIRHHASVRDLYNSLRGVAIDEVRAVADAIQAGEDGAYERVQALLDGRPFEPPRHPQPWKPSEDPPARRSAGGPSAFATRARKLSRW